jgi:uncharacterized protein (TIGR02265 family)
MSITASQQEMTPRDLEHRQEELEQRLARINPADTLRGLFFNGVLKAVKEEEDEGKLKRCLEASGGAHYLAFFSYPATSLLRLLHTAAVELSEKRGGYDAAMRYLGRQMSPSFLESAAGRALLLLSGGSPRLLLNSMPMAYRTAMEHGECQVEWDGPKHGFLHLKGNALPAQYFEGSLQETFRVARMEHVSVKGWQHELDHIVLEISW